MVNKIAALIPENVEYLNEIKACMLSNAALLTIKVDGAEAAELYNLKLENAAIIRKAARDLMVQQHSLKVKINCDMRIIRIIFSARHGALA
jgi:hypothetical protein